MKCPSPGRGVRVMGEAVSFSSVVQPVFVSLLLSAKYIIKVIIDDKIFKKFKMMSFTVIFFVAML